MRKVVYPKGKPYENVYKNIFQTSIASMRTKWSNLQLKYPHDLGILPQNIEDILLASYSDLVRWYIGFMQLPLAVRKTMNSDMDSLFDYEKWSEKIAEYFTNPNNGFNFFACHYCDSSYINAYKIDPDADGLYFLNVASDEELDKITKSISRKNTLKSQRPFTNRLQFDTIAAKYKWIPDKWDRVFHPQKKYKHHFDLDHVLPKSECGFVALSLYNFVPSCQVCNQRLKKTKVLGIMGVPNVDLSPTSPTFDFEKNVEFQIVPNPYVKVGRLRPTRNPQDYTLQLVPQNPDYEYFIKMFKLDERYQQHKMIALHWLEMKSKYSDSRIKMMEASLRHRSFSFKRIRSDIFQSELYDNGYLSFSKLRNDMLK